MKFRRAISALGMAFALSFGLVLAPSQADAATLSINPRANAIEVGQVLAAPDGSVFTITVYDAALATGQKSISHTYVTGNTLRQTANKIVQAINADTDLQAIGVTAVLGTGANYTINSISASGTLYKQTTTGGGLNQLAIQQTLTIGGTVTVDDKLTLTIYDAGLVGGKEAIVYKPNTGDTIADIVIRLRNKINNSTTLAALGITAKVSSTDSSVLLIESPTFDATEKFTSYSAKVKTGGTETMTLGSFWGTNGAQTLSLTGPVNVGEIVEFTVVNPDLPDSHRVVSYTTQAGDNLNKVRCGLRTEVNNDAELAEIGVHATCSGGVLNLTTTSTSPTQSAVFGNVFCTVINPSPSKWPAAGQAKTCGSAAAASASIVRQTLEALGDPNSPPQRIPFAADKLTANSSIVFYVYSNHNEFYDSGDAPWHQTGGPFFLTEAAIESKWKFPPDLDSRSRFLGYSFAQQLSLIFEQSGDHYESPPFVSNHTIAHATAHEAGHQFSALAGNLANSPEFQQAWNRDMQFMSQVPPCTYEAIDADGNYASSSNQNPLPTGGLDGLYTATQDSEGNFVCGTSGGRTSNYPGDSVAVLGQAFPYFQPANGDPVPDFPVTEVFPEIFAFRAGFPDTINNAGAEIPGNNTVLNAANALLCSQLYVSTWAEFGRNPSHDELAGTAYLVPAGGAGGVYGPTYTLYKCDGSTETGEFHFGA